MNDFLSEVCENCGYTFGSHHAGRGPWLYNYCPSHEGEMNWEKEPGTTFESTGIYKEKEEEAK